MRAYKIRRLAIQQRDAEHIEWASSLIGKRKPEQPIVIQDNEMEFWHHGWGGERVEPRDGVS